MDRQLFCGTVICVILWFCAVAKSDETFEDKRNVEKQLSIDVVLLQESIEDLQGKVEVLRIDSNSQFNLLEYIKDVTEEKSPSDGVCDSISRDFNKTHHKLNVFEERIVGKLEDIQDEQLPMLKNILDKQELLRNCRPDSALDVMSTALSKINDKIDKFEVQLKNFEALEQKLKQPQQNVQSVNAELMKMLKEINEKLTQNQEKFDKFEKELPVLMEITKEATDSTAHGNPKLPIDMILGLTQNSPLN